MRDRLLASAARQVAEYDADITDLRLALGGLDGGKTQVEPGVQDSKVTIKDMVLEILALCPEGATAQQLLQSIKERFKVDLRRESLSPQLSRLRGEDGKIELRGKCWFLASAAPRGLLDGLTSGNAADLVHVHIGTQQ